MDIQDYLYDLTKLGYNVTIIASPIRQGMFSVRAYKDGDNHKAINPSLSNALYQIYLEIKRKMRDVSGKKDGQ